MIDYTSYMFEFIRGKLVSALPHRAVVDAHGIGYGIGIALSTFPKLPPIGQEVFFYLSPIIREDQHLLYGFLTQSERDLFDKINLISGIGPKTSIALLGHLEITDLQMAVLHSNVALLSKVPGIGKKTAERLVIELRDKVKNVDLSTSTPDTAKGVVADALSALANLGYHPIQAQKAIRKVLEGKEKEPDLSSLITAALRSM